VTNEKGRLLLGKLASLREIASSPDISVISDNSDQ